VWVTGPPLNNASLQTRMRIETRAAVIARIASVVNHNRSGGGEGGGGIPRRSRVVFGRFIPSVS